MKRFEMRLPDATQQQIATIRGSFGLQSDAQAIIFAVNSVARGLPFPEYQPQAQSSSPSDQPVEGDAGLIVCPISHKAHINNAQTCLRCAPAKDFTQGETAQ
jgi:hypothetical protein